jgi:hypothetical protein
MNPSFIQELTDYHEAGLLTYYTGVDKNIMKPGFDTGADYCIIKPRFIHELTDYHEAGFQNENKL